MGARTPIRDWTGWIVGWVETDDITGDKIARDFQGRILGFYRKRLDVTTDFFGRQLYRGDNVQGLVVANAEKEQQMKNPGKDKK